MYRVIIVEDELLVRMGLKNSIDWGRHDMQVVADAADGKTAFEMYEKLNPDMIITDLNMPMMSGMELISKIREKDKDVKIVILTCLEEFELARKAVSLGVSDYIVKHMMTVEQIGEVLSRVRRELSANALKVPNDLNQANAGIAKEKLMKNLLLYGRYSEEEFARFPERYHVRRKGPKLLLCVMEVSHYGRVKSAVVRDTLLNMLNDTLSFYGNGEVAFDDDSEYTVVFGYTFEADREAILKDLFSVLQEVESSVRGLFNTTASFGLSDIGTDYSQLHTMYLQAMDALKEKFFGGAGVYGCLLPFGRDTVKTGKTEEMIKLCEATLNSPTVLFAGYFARIRAIVKDGGADGPEYLQQFGKLIQWAVSTVKVSGDASEQITVSAVSTLESLQQCETLDEALRCLYDYFSAMNGMIRRKKITSREVKQAVDYIDANYSGNLSLQQVADHVKLSPNYLSSLFKKEIDSGFTEYLTDVRIEKAKELLLDTYFKTYEIAESVGFSENAYFCKIFKKATGKTPGEFRKQWLMSSVEEPEDETIQRR